MSAIAPERDATSRCGPSLVERGASYLLVKLRNAAAQASDQTPLAMVLWSALEQHFTYHLVLDMERADCLDEASLKQLMTLSQWVVAQHGTIRLCGLSDHDQDILEQFGDSSCLPAYADIGEAIFAGHSPRLPR